MRYIDLMMQICVCAVLCIFGFSLLYGRSLPGRISPAELRRRRRMSGIGSVFIVFFAWTILHGAPHVPDSYTWLFTLAFLGFATGAYVGWVLDAKEARHLRDGTPYDFDLPGPAGDPPIGKEH